MSISNITCENNSNNSFSSNFGGTCFVFRNTDSIYLNQILVLNSRNYKSTIGIKIIHSEASNENKVNFRNKYLEFSHFSIFPKKGPFDQL